MDMLPADQALRQACEPLPMASGVEAPIAPLVSAPLQARVRIAGSGAFVPSGRRTSAEIDRRTGRAAGTTAARTGVIERPVVTTETSSGMAIEAARRAIAASGLSTHAIDLVVSACAVPEQPIPAMAPLIQSGLGLAHSGIPAFDVNASCLSFVTAFDIVAQMIDAGRIKTALIVSSEIASRALPWEASPDTAALFGDGAAAVVVAGSDGRAGGLVASHMETWSTGYRDCELASGGTRFDFHQDRDAFASGAVFRMDGRSAYRLVARVVVPFFERLLSKAGWRLDDVDVVVPHQASRGSLDHLVEKLKIPRHKIVDLIATNGNQIAASIPTALHHALASGRAPPGSKVLVVGTSAGFSIGGLCLEIA
jgi:3-oxoacyl-[acyl-carrier-protein] synthase-3